jgi:murein DD-endopeptidase MepM/ murein hydrolase activator NlpD
MREGNSTHFLVENKELCDVTMTFEMNLVNLKADVAFPYTGTFPPGQVTEALTVSAINPEAKWEYSYTNFYKIGSNCARHDDSYIYQLPYAPGTKFHVTQAYNGSFSHKGSNRYAIDWEMPEGTPVFAARGGLVVRIRDNSNTGGASLKFDRFNNYVLIRHNDGTLGHYCHLQQGGCVVKVGQPVKAGDLLAHSGNTGFSSGPHLHFCVFRTKDGKDRESIPVRFKTADSEALTIVSGRTYRAAKLPPTATTAKVASEPGNNESRPKT